MQTLRVWLKAGHTVEIIRRLLPDFRASTGIEVALDVVPEGVAHDALMHGSPVADVVTVQRPTSGWPRMPSSPLRSGRCGGAGSCGLCRIP
jgi:hypothetical protein